MGLFRLMDSPSLSQIFGQQAHHKASWTFERELTISTFRTSPDLSLVCWPHKIRTNLA